MPNNMSIDKVYWDSDCFLALLKAETDKIDKCKGTIEKAEKGELLIIASAITLIEVIKMKGKQLIKREAEKKIRAFFDNAFISIRNVDREIGIIARDLLWKHISLKPKDSIHVATAIFCKVPKLNTFDEGLLKLSNQFGDNPKLEICIPDIPYQGELFDDTNSHQN